MKIFALCASFLISLIGLAQVTITETDFASPGDTAMVSWSDETTLDYITTGSNATWDFSGVNISAQAIDTFHAVSSSEILFQLIFNNGFTYPDNESDWFHDWDAGGLNALSQFGVDIEKPVRFTQVNSGNVENTGFGFYVQGNGIPAKSDTIDIQYELPMNYSDSWTSNSYTYLDLNPTIDAIWIRYQWRNSIVDGWGQITTPFGTFDAIRVKSLVSSTDSLWAGMLGSWFELPNPDQVEYEWYTNGQKMPIFKIVTSDIAGNETVSEVKFKDKYRTFASNEELTFEGTVYPNPTNDEVHISMIEPTSLLQVLDMSGRVVFEHSFIEANSPITIKVADWAPGMYVIKAYQNDAISSTKLLVE